MFIVDSFDIGSKYYWKSKYDLFLTDKKKIFICILQTMLVYSVYKFDTLCWKNCEIYEQITNNFITKFMNFISKFYTSHGLKL